MISIFLWRMAMSLASCLEVRNVRIHLTPEPTRCSRNGATALIRGYGGDVPSLRPVIHDGARESTVFPTARVQANSACATLTHRDARAR